MASLKERGREVLGGAQTREPPSLTCRYLGYRQDAWSPQCEGVRWVWSGVLGSHLFRLECWVPEAGCGMQGGGGTWLLGTSSAPCVWVCDYPRQLSAGQDSLVYIAEGNENILTRRCLLGVQCLVGAGERCLTLSGEGNSY